MTNYGWKKRNIKPQLFMQRADDAIRPDVIPMIEAELGSILREKGFQ